MNEVPCVRRVFSFWACFTSSVHGAVRSKSVQEVMRGTVPVPCTQYYGGVPRVTGYVGQLYVVYVLVMKGTSLSAVLRAVHTSISTADLWTKQDRGVGLRAKQKLNLNYTRENKTWC